LIVAFPSPVRSAVPVCGFFPSHPAPGRPPKYSLAANCPSPDLHRLVAPLHLALVLALDGEVRVLRDVLRLGDGDPLLLLGRVLLVLGGRAGQPGGEYEAGGEKAGDERTEHESPGRVRVVGRRQLS
jgi:hypothetical protein